MLLCAPCVAAIMNNPGLYELGGYEDKDCDQQLWAETIESYAVAADGGALPRIRARADGRRLLTLRSVTKVNGLPMCVWCAAAYTRALRYL